MNITDDTLMPFGKYRGQRLGDIPDDYFEWLYDQTWFTQQSHGELWEYARRLVEVKAKEGER